MRFLTIPSAQIPKVSDEVKECVNQGTWILYTSSTQNKALDTVYFLQAGQTVYELDEDGLVLHVRSSVIQAPEIDELISFMDLPQPSSLSNGALPVRRKLTAWAVA